MQNKTFKNIAIDHTKVEACLQAQTTDFKATVKSDKHIVYSGKYQGIDYAINFFINKDGKCTIGQTAKFDKTTFEKVAEAIVSGCGYGTKQSLNISIQNIQPDQVTDVVAYLQSQGANVEESVSQALFTEWRIRGPRGDRVVLKHYKTQTFQAQGPHAQVAAWIFEYLVDVLNLEAALDQQRKIYRIPLTVQEVKDELKARIPAVHDYLAEPVRKQFSSAYAFTKVGIELEDYSALAFPALRGIEGFCFQLLRTDCKFDPTQKAQLGDYFEKVGGGYEMRAPHKTGVQPELKNLLDKSYTFWYKQRHGLFHMDGTVETSRVLSDRAAAVAITSEVLDFVDKAFEQYVLAKP